MNNHKLYNELKEAYSDENLNKLTAQIIQLYKSGFHSAIRDIQEILSSYFNFTDKRIQKCFAKLMKIYHPDKGNLYRMEINELYKQGKFEELEKFNHILQIQKYEEIALASVDTDFDIDYHPQYVWDDGSSDLEEDFVDFGSDNSDYGAQTQHQTQPLYNKFISVLKRIIYGNIDIEIPQYYLTELEEIEMGSYDVESLEGVELCQNLIYLNLSRNCITNIAELSNLFLLEELNLSSNQINYIDALSCLNSLRILDLSDNCIEDISPILNLNNLEFVDLTNNPVDSAQLFELKKRKIAVIY